MKNLIKKIAIATFITLSMSQAMAQSSLSFGIQPIVGSRGVGADLIFGVNEYFKFRLGATQLNYNYQTTHQYTDANQNSYNFDVNMNIKGGNHLLLDVHPFAGKFKITTGLYSMNNGFNASANPTGSSIVFNGTTYTINDVQKVQADIEWKNRKPYIGLGFDGYVGNSGLFFASDFGVIVGAPTNKVTITCSANPTPGFDCAQANRDAQAEFDQEFTKNKKYLKYYPVIQIGIGYKF